MVRAAPNPNPNPSPSPSPSPSSYPKPEPKPEPNPKPRPNPNQVALLATQAVGVLVRAAEQPVEELRLGGLLLGCGLLLLALRMGKPLGGGLAEEDSAQP